jgi:cobalt-zinc-cadmium efflux system outer membrane protein
MIKLFSIYGVVLAAVFVATAQPLTTNLTAESAVMAALENNRDLVAARLAIRQAEGRLKQAGLWSNPEWETSYAPDTAFANEGEYNFSTGFKQRFPVTGRLGKTKAVAKVDVEMAAAEVSNQERLLTGDVLGRFRGLLILQQQLQANQEIQDTLGKLVTMSERRAKAAEVSETDVNLAKLELQKMQLSGQSLLIEQETAITALNQLLGREPNSPLEISGQPPMDFDSDAIAETEGNALTHRADRQLAALSVNRAAAEIKLARAEKWDDWTVGFDYARDEQKFVVPVGDKLDQFLGLSVSIPLPFWNRNQGKISEVQANQQRAEAELNALDLRITGEMQTAADRVRRLSDILRQYREQSLKLAGDNITLLQKGYGDGLVNMATVVQAEQQSADIRLNYLETLAQFEHALTDWQTATASFPLDQK